MCVFVSTSIFVLGTWLNSSRVVWENLFRFCVFAVVVLPIRSCFSLITRVSLLLIDLWRQVWWSRHLRRLLTGPRRTHLVQLASFDICELCHQQKLQFDDVIDFFFGGMRKTKEIDMTSQHRHRKSTRTKNIMWEQTLHTVRHVSKQFVPCSFLARSFSSTRKLQHGANLNDSTKVLTHVGNKSHLCGWQQHIFSEAQIIFLTGMWPGYKSWCSCPSHSSWN